MRNYGKAKVKVEYNNNLPNIAYKSFYNLDVNAYNWALIQNSPFFPPQLTEQTQDDMGTFAVCYPAKRKFFINNSTKTLTVPPAYISWTNETVTEGLVKSKIENSGNPFTQINVWDEKSIDKPAVPDDTQVLNQFKQRYVLGVSPTPTPTPTPTPSTTPPVPQMLAIEQKQVSDGKWWGIKSCNFLSKNTPFWLDIDRDLPPTSNNYETFIIISLGINSTTDAYDLYLSNTVKPQLLDYKNGRGVVSGEQPSSFVMQFPDEISKIILSDKHLELGFMVAAGRLIIFVNKSPIVYTRIWRDASDDEKFQTFREAQIAAGGIRVYGTNCKVTMYASYMTFASEAWTSYPVFNPPDKSIYAPSYKGMDEKGDYSGSTSILPKEKTSNDDLFGVDCREFTDPDEGVVSPSGTGFRLTGKIAFFNFQDISQLPDTNDSNFYVMHMQSEATSVTINTTAYSLPNGASPFFFRLHGGLDIDEGTGNVGNWVDASANVLNVSETCAAPDYFHIKSNAQIILYNKNNQYGFFRDYQYAIRINWAWQADEETPEYTQTFMGIVIGASFSEIPGKETVTLTCEDCMYILNNNPMVNSPFFDGMILFYAIQLMAKKSGIRDDFVIDDTPDAADEYFLPSGYSFSQPSVKFDYSQTIFDCMMFCIKRDQAYIRFDAYGYLRFGKFPGGWFSYPVTIVANFSRSIDTSDNIILNEKTVNYDFDSTANRISIWTLDKDTRNSIFYTKSADVNRIIFRKVYLIDQPAYGKYEVAVAAAEDYGKRVFFPIKKMSFTSIGNPASSLLPLDCVTVDDETFRVLSLNRKFAAETNDYTVDYTCEWLGGE